MTVQMRSFSGSALLALSLALAPASAYPAETPQEQAASKALLAAQKAAVKEFRTELAGVSKQLSGELTVMEAELKAGADADGLAELLFGKLVELQVTVTALVAEAADAQADAAVAELSALALPEGQYPAAFYPGDGTAAGLFEASLGKELSKVYGKLVKRLDKTVDRFDQAGALLTLRLRAPEVPARVWNTTFVNYFLAPTVSIDVALAWSAAATVGAGRLRVAGRAQTLFGYEEDVIVTATAIALDDVSVAVAPVSERYELAVSSNLLEGSYLLGATQGGLSPVALSIGLR